MSEWNDWKFYFTEISLKVGGIASCIGSVYIVQDVLCDPVKRSRSIYHRLMLGLSIMDILSSFFLWILSSWAMPKGSYLWAVGTLTTCDICGFLGMVGWSGSTMYNCSLATFYLLQLKLEWIDRRIKAIEKWLHILPWSVGLVVAIFGLASNGLGPGYGYCAFTYGYPRGCQDPDSQVECIRGQKFDIYALYSLVFIAIVYVSISMYHVYTHVSAIEKNALKFSFIARFKEENRKKTRKRSRRVMIQGILYSVTMVLLWLCGVITTIFLLTTKNGSLTAGIIFNIINPLQGLFNVFIYLIPVFRKILKSNRQGDYASSIGTPYIQNKFESNGDTEEKKREIPVEYASYPEFNKEKGNEDEVTNNHHHDIVDDNDNEEKREKTIKFASLQDFNIEDEGNGEKDINEYHHHAIMDNNENNDRLLLK